MNKVLHGDCLELMGGMEGDVIDLTVTSPPYDNLRDYKGYRFDFEGIAKELYRITKPGGVVVWVVGDATIKGSETGTSFCHALYFKEIGFRLHDTMIYQKYGSGMPHKAHRYGQTFEYMFVLSKGSPSHGEIKIYPTTGRTGPTTRRHKDGSIKKGRYNIGGGKFPNIWQYPGEIRVNHPAPFPEKLAEDHILSWSNPGDLVFDPMAGSGTTLKMAKINGRDYLGCEISEEYVGVARERLNEA